MGNTVDISTAPAVPEPAGAPARQAMRGREHHRADTESAQLRAARWLEENQAAIAEWNAYVEKHGLPLTAFRDL